ncbi:hypothetical protein EDB83DRAFT_2534583 [Lactarius deliciosus]|nr:hypothetical protein EDB83DRAFT_2534583 [Lactarius deliciosus]
MILITVADILLRPYSSCCRDAFGPSRSLYTWLADEEALYAVAIQDQLDPIKKWGHRDDAVDPYPTYGEFYAMCASSIRPPYPTSGPHRVQRVGTLGNGEKWVCGLDQEDKCVIYSFGINGESSFESTLLTRGPGPWGPDILKIDIEGGEFDALTAFLSTHAAAEGDVPSVGQLQLEIHAREGHENSEYFAR